MQLGLNRQHIRNFDKRDPFVCLEPVFALQAFYAVRKVFGKPYFTQVFDFDYINVSGSPWGLTCTSVVVSGDCSICEVDVTKLFSSSFGSSLKFDKSLAFGVFARLLCGKFGRPVNPCVIQDTRSFLNGLVAAVLEYTNRTTSLVWLRQAGVTAPRLPFHVLIIPCLSMI